MNDPEKPQKVGYWISSDWASGVFAQGGYAYVADWYDGLRVLDVSDPANPHEVGYRDTKGYAMGVFVNGEYAYVADATSVQVIDVTDPKHPEIGGYYDTQGNSMVQVQYSEDGYIYVAGDSYGLYILKNDLIDTPIEKVPIQPKKITLSQNYPNPFNPATHISYTLLTAEHVTLSLYNTLGQLVATLADESQLAGSHTVTFDASSLPSGVYIYSLKAGGITQTRKMTLIK